jgi:seryl-tRNA synthetase
MKALKSTILFIAFFFMLQSVAVGSGVNDRDKALDLFKKYINNMVQRVEKAENPARKREILNSSFDNMISAFNTVQNMGLISQNDKEAITTLKADIKEKKNELNGLDSYRRVADNNLNNFANYVQQDLEQADTVVISISATLLAAILILLLLL